MVFRRIGSYMLISLHSASISPRSYLHKAFTKRSKTAKLLRIALLETREANIDSQDQCRTKDLGCSLKKVEREAKRSGNLRNGIQIAQEENLIGLIGVSIPTEGEAFSPPPGFRVVSGTA
jgi:hypothetical protein